MDCSLPGSSVHGIFQARLSLHRLLQGIFLTQELNLGLWHCRQILYHCTLWKPMIYVLDDIKSMLHFLGGL